MYSWRWSPDQGGKILDVNTATDADQDIAFALIIAAAAFKDSAYLDRARELVKAIRLHTGIALAKGWLPSAGNWAVDERIIQRFLLCPLCLRLFCPARP